MPVLFPIPYVSQDLQRPSVVTIASGTPAVLGTVDLHTV